MAPKVEYIGPLAGAANFHGYRFSSGRPLVDVADADADWFRGRQHFRVLDGSGADESADADDGGSAPPDGDNTEPDAGALARLSRDELDVTATALGLDPSEYPNKEALAEAIIEARAAGGSDENVAAFARAHSRDELEVLARPLGVDPDAHRNKTALAAAILSAGGGS